VKQSGEKERQLVSHKLSINTQFVVKKTNMQEHFNSMEDLNKKIMDIGQAKATLENQIEALMKEITSMTNAVEHSANKIRQMIRKTKSQENTYTNFEVECDKLRSANQYLFARLEKVSSLEGSENRRENLLLEIKSLGSECKEINHTHEDLLETIVQILKL
jgi:chromosome segregation ATPase